MRKHYYAIEAIQAELCSLGGKMFAEEFVNAVVRAKAGTEDEVLKKEVDMHGFLTKLLGSQVDENNQKFKSLLNSLVTLSKDK